MTQTNLTRPQALSRIDPTLRGAAIELGVVEFRTGALRAEWEHANLLAAERAAAVDTVESRSIAGPDDQQLGLRLYRGITGSPHRSWCTPTAAAS
jgi:acetyl esterase